MARPLRLEFPGAIYHVTARGDRREPIFHDDTDRIRFLDLLGREAGQQGWLMYAYCLMGNHYHLLLETPEANLSKGMRRLNGVYAQAFNRRHHWTGHVLQGRYKAIFVDRDSYLLELCRYVVLNPVRASMVDDPSLWPWSSYRTTAGMSQETKTDWLATQPVWALFGSDPDDAPRRYRHFVAAGTDQPSPWTNLAGQIYLGGEEFLRRMQQLAATQSSVNIPAVQLKPIRLSIGTVLDEVAQRCGIAREQVLDRSNGMAFKLSVYRLRRDCGLALREVAGLAGVSSSRVSQIQAEIESKEAG